MKATRFGFALPVLALVTAALDAQQPAPTTYTQTLTYIKVAPGKAAEYEQLLNETLMKVSQLRADSGEIISWTLLRCVLPAGQEARASHVISVISEGPPLAPTTRAELGIALQKAGVTISVEEFYQKRRDLSSLVASEIWRPQQRVAAPKKGHYLYLNHMKVHDAAAYAEFEKNIWRPMAEEWVKRGEMSGWIFATKVLPGGTETAHSAYSADMFPTWQAAFGMRSSLQSIFEKVHPGKNYDDVVLKGLKLRDLARRELWVVVERVEKST